MNETQPAGRGDLTRGRGPATETLKRLAWLNSAQSAVWTMLTVFEVLRHEPASRILITMAPALLVVGSASHHSEHLAERKRHQVVYPDADPGELFERPQRA